MYPHRTGNVAMAVSLPDVRPEPTLTGAQPSIIPSGCRIDSRANEGGENLGINQNDKKTLDPGNSTDKGVPNHVYMKRRRQRSLALLVALLSFSVLFYAVTIVRMGDRIAAQRLSLPR